MKTRLDSKLPTILAAILAITLLAPLAAAGSETEWPEWRGPMQSMAVPAEGTFDEGFVLEVDWRAPVGPAYSSVSVASGRAVTMFSDGEKDVIAAFDAVNGAELWRYEIGPTYRGHSGAEDGPVGTPTIHQGRVYALGPEGDLIAARLDDGSEVWRRSLTEEYGSKPPVYGFSAAPIVAAGILVVAAGGSDGRAIVGLDPATGKELWAAGDDTVGYQSPRFTRIAGTPQVVAATDIYLYGLVPKTGEVLWRHKHREKPESDGGMAQPVLVGDDRVLLHYWQNSTLVEITRDAEGWTTRELWRERGISDSAVTPIYHEGSIYGYRGRFLTCVDPATGEARWKSRPPGMGGLSMIDGHLVTLGPDGELVVAAVSADGYDERARLAIAERYSLAPPSFAGGRLYLRDMKEIVAVAVRPAAGGTADDGASSRRGDSEHRRARGETGQGGERGDFDAFLAHVEAAADDGARRDRVHDFLAGRELPILEDGGQRVHFLYYGEAEEVALAGDFLDVGEERSMTRVAGTDLYVHSAELEPAARYHYRFVLDFEHRTLDPRNPRQAWTPEGLFSVLMTPGWTPPIHLDELPADAPRWRIESFAQGSDILRNGRQVHVFLPPSYDRSRGRYPLLIVLDGENALRYGRLDRALAQLSSPVTPASADRSSDDLPPAMRPAVVVFVPAENDGEYRTRAESHARMLVEELLPRLEARYRLGDERAIYGAGEAAYAAVKTVADHPGVFDRVALQSFYVYPYGEGWSPGAREALLARLEELAPARLPARWHLEWSRHDLSSVAGLREADWIPRDARADSRFLATFLEGKEGVVVTTGKISGGAGWANWAARAGAVLGTLFPLAEISSREPQ